MSNYRIIRKYIVIITYRFVDRFKTGYLHNSLLNIYLLHGLARSPRSCTNFVLGYRKWYYSARNVEACQDSCFTSSWGHQTITRHCVSGDWFLLIDRCKNLIDLIVKCDLGFLTYNYSTFLGRVTAAGHYWTWDLYNIMICECVFRGNALHMLPVYQFIRHYQVEYVLWRVYKYLMSQFNVEISIGHH